MSMALLVTPIRLAMGARQFLQGFYEYLGTGYLRPRVSKRGFPCKSWTPFRWGRLGQSRRSGRAFDVWEYPRIGRNFPQCAAMLEAPLRCQGSVILRPFPTIIPNLKDFLCFRPYVSERQ